MDRNRKKDPDLKQKWEREQEDKQEEEQITGLEWKEEQSWERNGWKKF